VGPRRFHTNGVNPKPLEEIGLRCLIQAALERLQTLSEIVR